MDDAETVIEARRGRRMPYLPLRSLIPNAITMLALCAGATGVRFAISGEFEKAAAAVVIAGVLDGLDGRVARMLKGTSRFGAELDSLSDVTAFGIAPALIMYLWALQYLGGLGWVIALAHAVCCALRLARFNAALDMEDGSQKRLGFLTGIPAPAAAGIALSPLFLSLATGWFDSEPMWRAVAAAALLGITALGMVSTWPTWGWKAIRMPRGARVPALVFVGLFAAALAQSPWWTLTAVTAVYLLTAPLATLRMKRLLRGEARLRPPAATSGPASERPMDEAGRSADGASVPGYLSRPEG